MKKNKYIFVAVFVLLIFSEIIAQKVPFFSFVEEAIAIIAILRIILKRGKTTSNRMMTLLAVLLAIGIISNFFSGLNTSPFAIIVDAFTTFKAYFIYLGFSDIVKGDKESEHVSKSILWLARIITIAAFVFWFLNMFSVVNMTENLRYGLKEYKFIFLNAGSFGYYLMALFPFLEKDKKKIFIILGLFLIVSTLKGPQIIFAFLYIYNKFLRRIRGFRKVNILLLPAVIVVMLFMSKYQIENYITNTESARYILTEKSIVTANNYFPLGSGFATYGSEMAKRYYSQLYYRYGFNEIYGLGGESLSYLNDDYWQMIVAQLGYFGLALNVILMIVLSKCILKDFEKSKHYVWAKCMLICVLIGSLGSAYITGCAFSTIIFSACLLRNGGKNE